MKIRRWRQTALIGCTIAVWASLASAQREGVEIIRTLRPSFSPPLRDIPPIPPPGGPLRVIPIRPIPLPDRPLREQPDGALQTSVGPAVATTAGSNFDGVGVGFVGPQGSFIPDAAPPDTNGAVGGTQYVQWVNESFAVFDKATGRAVYGPAAGSTLWAGFGGGCQNNNDGDPIVQYDKLANRWIFTQFSVSTTPFLQCIAVSTTSDATGSYNRYALQMNNFPDYPKLGVWSDGYYMSFNMFAPPFYFFVGAQIWAFDRAAMLAGQSANAVGFQLSSAYGGLLPSDLDGTNPPPAGSPNYFLNFGSNTLNLWKFKVTTWGDSTCSPTTGSGCASATLTGPTSIGVAAFSTACGGGACVPQKDTTQKLDSLGDRLMYRLAYRNFGDHEALVVNHSVKVGGGRGSSGSVGVRWYELRSPGGTPTVFQQGTYAPTTDYRWMGSIAMDHVGNMALGYSVSSSTMNPAIRYTGRVPSDPAGTMQAESSVLCSSVPCGTGSQLVASNGAGSRWGDYSSMSVDPVDDCTFWYTTEYLQSSGDFNWSTRVASFKFGTCSLTPSPDFSLSATPASQTVNAGSSTTYTVTVTPSNGFLGTVNLSATGLPSGVSIGFSPNPVTGGSGSSTMTVTTSASTPAGTYTITITGTSGSLTHTTPVTLTVNSTSGTGTFSLSASPGNATVKGAGTATYTVTVTPSGGFTGDVSLSASGLPSGSTVSFNPVTVTNGSGTSTMAVTTTSSTPVGTYTITITGTSGSLTSSTSVRLKEM